MEKSLNPENPNRETVRRAIGFNRLAYDNLIHKYFVTWCEEMALRFFYSDRDLMQNESLWKWYQAQWAILAERTLLNDYGRYMRARIPNTKDFFYKRLCENAETLEQYYPAALIRKQKPGKQKMKFTFNLN